MDWACSSLLEQKQGLLSMLYPRHRVWAAVQRPSAPVSLYSFQFPHNCSNFEILTWLTSTGFVLSVVFPATVCMLLTFRCVFEALRRVAFVLCFGPLSWRWIVELCFLFEDWSIYVNFGPLFFSGFWWCLNVFDPSAWFLILIQETHVYRSGALKAQHSIREESWIRNGGPMFQFDPIEDCQKKIYNNCITFEWDAISIGPFVRAFHVITLDAHRLALFGTTHPGGLQTRSTAAWHEIFKTTRVSNGQAQRSQGIVDCFVPIMWKNVRIFWDIPRLSVLEWILHVSCLLPHAASICHSCTFMMFHVAASLKAMRRSGHVGISQFWGDIRQPLLC